jgi:hypothetical protein
LINQDPQFSGVTELTLNFEIVTINYYTP